MANEITILYKGQKIAKIKTNTPSLSELVKFVTDTENIDVSQIACECPAENFDTEFFAQAVREAIEEEISSLKLNKEKYDQCIQKCKDNIK